MTPFFLKTIQNGYCVQYQQYIAKQKSGESAKPFTIKFFL